MFLARFRILLVLLLAANSLAVAHDDQREWVILPEMMQKHMMANMRDHLRAIDEILGYLSTGQLDRAAEVAEFRLGVSSLDKHGAHQMGKRMPEGMRQMGTRMHRAATRFALTAQEGEVLPAYSALGAITGACVACHSGYRLR